MNNPSPTCLGGKGHALHALKEHVPVPRFAVLEAGVFEHFLMSLGLRETYGQYWDLATSAAAASDDLDRLRKELLQIIGCAPLPATAKTALATIYAQVEAPSKIARSSATVEDAVHTSWAGQFVSIFDISTLADWTLAVRKCWASVMLASVAEYARTFREHHAEPPGMAVVLQAVVDARASGVAFSHNPSGLDDRPVLEATWGVAPPLVNGAVSPERWTLSADGLAHRTTGHQGDTVWLLDTYPTDAPGTSVFLEAGNDRQVEVRKDNRYDASGIWSGVPVLVRERALQVLDAHEATALLETVQAQSLRQGRPVDMEWAIDRDHRQWWVQIRPDTAREGKPPARAVAPTSSGTPLACGTPGNAGWVTGPAWWFEQDKPVSEPHRPILFKRTTDPRDIATLLQVGGLATQDGGLLCHSAIVSRELGLPCLIGVYPFPPELDIHNQIVTLDAEHGEIKAAASGAAAAPQYVAPPVGLTPPRVLHTRPEVDWQTGEALARRVPEAVKVLLRRIAALPGLISPVQVLPDLRLREKHIGIPIGVSFKSRRFHPTAVCDLGDGFRLVELRGLSARAVLDNRAALLTAFYHWMAEDGPLHEAVHAQVDLDAVFVRGLPALADTSFAERAPRRVEQDGFFPGGDYQSLPPDLKAWAATCLAWHGESGHFIEILLQGDVDTDVPDLDRPPLLFFHTGSIELGIHFFNHTFFRGRKAALIEGIDDQDSIFDGFWGLDITRPLGRNFLANAIGLVNYSFARRAILQRLAEHALADVFGQEIDTVLVSDIVHSAVRADQDGVWVQQGVQRVCGEEETLPMVLAGAPRVNSYLFMPRRGPASACLPHGKIYMTPHPDFLRPQQAQHHAAFTLLDGNLGIDDYRVEVADAQVREALHSISARGDAHPTAALFPAVCMRGRKNNQPKIFKEQAS